MTICLLTQQILRLAAVTVRSQRSPILNRAVPVHCGILQLLPHSLIEWENVNLSSPSSFLFAIPPKKKEKKKSKELMTFIAPVCRQHSEILSVYGEQLVPMWASDELCRDVLVEVICLLWGSREDVEKSAPSQLLQGVLQCRGLTEKVEGKRQLVCSLSASVYHRASLPLPTTAFVFYYLFPTSLLHKFTSSS